MQLFKLSLILLSLFGATNSFSMQRPLARMTVTAVDLARVALSGSLPFLRTITRAGLSGRQFIAGVTWATAIGFLVDTAGTSAAASGPTVRAELDPVRDGR